MTTIEKIDALILNKRINTNTLERDCNLARSTVLKWRKGEAKPTANTLVKLAKYFNVTTDYLHGLTDNPNPPPIENNTSQPQVTIPEDVSDALIAFHNDVDNLTQDEIDEAAAFIRARREMRKKK